MGDPTSLDAIVGGGLKSVFETKDFFSGETPKEDRSAFRRSVEDTVDMRREESMFDGFAAGVGQFAVGMIGLGKVTALSRGLPWVGKGLANMGSFGTAAAESAKAAAVGAIAFDPWEERLSNLVQDSPLANPLTEWLAADPADSAAEGRLKAVLESIALDATLIGVFTTSTKVWKALRNGDRQAASRYAGQLEAEAGAARSETDAAGPSAGVPQRPDAGPTAGPGIDPADGAPSPAVRASPDAPPAGGLREPGAVPEASPGGAIVSPEVVQPQATSPSALAAGDNATLTPSTGRIQPSVQYTTENTEAVLDLLGRDMDAIARHGGWYQAIEAGHVFGKGEGIPYVRLDGDQALDDFMARMTDAVEPRLDALKGGSVMTDKSVLKLAGQWTQLFNEDPASFMVNLQKAGAAAQRQTALAEAGMLVSRKMLEDSYTKALRVGFGDYSELGGRAEAMADLRKTFSLAMSVYGNTKSMVANSARTLRRQQFKVDPKLLDSLNQMDDEELVRLLSDTKGDPAQLAKLGEVTTGRALTDVLTSIYINNLVSGPWTQAVNLMGNSYMVGIRPFERIIGALPQAAIGNVESRRVLKESMRQYQFMSTALTSGFMQAAKAFARNDSVLLPHHTEAFTKGGPQAFREVRNVGDLLHNALVVPMPVLGLPTRTLGMVDELVKQTVYRSHVSAKAHYDGSVAAVAAGLKGKAAKQYVSDFVKSKVNAAFDSDGRGLDPEALREALVTTFQQDLGPNTLGRSVQSLTANHPGLRLVLPFVKTPTNILRYGWKMTPVLNRFQKEFSSHLAGEAGPALQAQARGQEALGVLFMGAAAAMVSQGYITGGGPKDPRLNSALRATGWQPYSIVTQNPDGSRNYVSYGRLDPVAIPFGIIADIQDAIYATEHSTEPTGVSEAIGALGIALAKQFTSKTYMTGLADTLEVMTDPERNLGKWAGRTASNFIPFSSALRQLNPDPHLREARDVADRMLSTIPGLSESLPARYDAWGDPIVSRKGLWGSDTDNVVDWEMQRLAIETGTVLYAPPATHKKVDLREVTMSDGRNAYEVYAQLSGQPRPGMMRLKDRVARLILTAAYRNAPDGDGENDGTKLYRLTGVVAEYRERAFSVLLRDPEVRAVMRRRQDAVIRHYQDLSVQARSGQRERNAEALRGLADAFGSLP